MGKPALEHSAEQRVEIAAIIVNYGTPELAIKAVESILNRDHGGRTVEIHLVDNASPDDSSAQFRKAFGPGTGREGVILHLEEVNHGFGRANNRVLERLAARDAPPDKVFLLNPDAALDNEAIAVLAEFMDTTPRAGAAGTRIRFPTGELRTAAFRFPSAAGEFAAAARLGPVSRILSRHQIAFPPDLQTQKVDWVAGAAVMFRFGALQAVGFFDPDFFLYYEEVELMWRLNRADWECWQIAEAVVTHEEGIATGVQSDDKQPKARPGYWYDSKRLYLAKTHGRASAIMVALAQYGGASIDLMVSWLRRRSPGTPHRFFADYWRLVLWPVVMGSRAPDT